MTPRLRLVLFDVDGTLVDSQADIISAMRVAFGDVGLPCPDREAVLSIVGLSLDHAMARLTPQQPETVHAALVLAYKSAFRVQRLAGAELPVLFPGAREMIDQLSAEPDILLGVATGNSQRGIEGMLDTLGLQKVFVTRQVADHHPSKPHPSMILTAISETGVDTVDTVMVGDTSYDMDMARAAGVAGIGVSWGYHAREHLHAASRMIDRFADLPNALDAIWKETT